jgi:membrane protein
MARNYLTRFGKVGQFIGNFGLLRPALGKFYNDNGFFLASGIAFNIFLYLIPLILLLSAIIAAYLYNEREVFDHIRSYFKNVSPVVDEEITRDLMELIENRRIVGIVGILGLVWFSTFVFGSIRIALEIVFRVENSRTIWRGIGVDLMMIGLVGVLLLLSLILSSFVTVIQSYDEVIPVEIGPTLQWILKYTIPFLLSFLMFFLIYRIIPNRELHFGPMFQASLFTGLLWELAKHLFAWYIAHFAEYSLFYGSLSALVISVVWVYVSSVILVLGGEFAYMLEEHRERVPV